MDSLWEVALNKGVIDSNTTSETYLSIVNPQGLVDLMGYNLKYIDKHFDAYDVIPKNTYVIGAFHWVITHFVVIDSEKEVIFDPIVNGSQTVKNGSLISMRFYSIV
jgi:hypothetical protein